MAHQQLRFRLAVSVAIGVAALIGVAAWWFSPHGGDEIAPPQPAPPPDPRVTYQGPYLNVRPEVQYVGDAACADCHADIAATYRQSAMGRSLEPIRAVAAAQRV